MMFFFLFGLSLAAVAPLDGQELRLLPGGCPVFWYSFNGRCYKYVATLMTWVDAEQHCLSQGANLVSIHSLEEENFVKMLIRNFDPAQGPKWIGLSDAQRDGAYFWTDGSPITHSYWHTGEPNNAGGSEPCVHTNSGPTGKWNDVVCTAEFAFVCKARPACQ